MKNIFSLSFLALLFMLISCNSDKKTSGESTTADAATTTGGQEAVKDDESAKDVVKVAVG